MFCGIVGKGVILFVIEFDWLLVIGEVMDVCECYFVDVFDVEIECGVGDLYDGLFELLVLVVELLCF